MKGKKKKKKKKNWAFLLGVLFVWPLGTEYLVIIIGTYLVLSRKAILFEGSVLLLVRMGWVPDVQMYRAGKKAENVQFPL